MTQQTLSQRRDRTGAIVEGALLADVTLVFLLIRAYLPLPPVRVLISVVATVPLVLLTQRRGGRIAVLATIAAYMLFSALVGPALAVAVLNVAVAAVLAGLTRRRRLGMVLAVLITGPAYAVLDLIIPQLVAIAVFRVPVKDLIDAARNFVGVLFNLVDLLVRSAGGSALRILGVVVLFYAVTAALRQRDARAAVAAWVIAIASAAFVFVPQLSDWHATPATLQQLKEWKKVAEDHWVFVWLGSTVLYGMLQMYLVVLVSEMVLRQVPDDVLLRRRAVA